MTSPRPVLLMPPGRNKLKHTIKNKRTYFQYTEEALAQAVQAIRTENKSIREACHHYGVPRSTVQDRISGRYKEQPRKVGPEPILGIDGEQKIVDWITELAKCGIPVSKEVLLENVAKIIKNILRENKFPEGRPGQTWYQNVLRRHPKIRVREPESINKAREAVRESLIKKWFTDLECFLIERGVIDIMNDPDRILNADETGVSLCPKSGKVLAPKGYKNVYIVKRGNENETITVLIMITASGKVCPPLVVFPYIKPSKAVVDSMPEGWIIGKTELGWMRSNVFYEYIANDFNNWLVENNIKKPVILFVDGHKSHMSMPLSQFCAENDIALPPNTTHIMQLADETLDTDMTQDIKNGFRKCGLFPFNPNKLKIINRNNIKPNIPKRKQTKAKESDSDIINTDKDIEINIKKTKVIETDKFNIIKKVDIKEINKISEDKIDKEMSHKSETAIDVTKTIPSDETFKKYDIYEEDEDDHEFDIF
ncbi:unnamed protein product, partial [Brenthis ino]